MPYFEQQIDGDATTIVPCVLFLAWVILYAVHIVFSCRNEMLSQLPLRLCFFFFLAVFFFLHFWESAVKSLILSAKSCITANKEWAENTVLGCIHLHALE